MKKWFSVIALVFTLLSIKATCFAADGEYIFRIKESGIMLFSMDEDISYLGDGLYKSKDLESIYSFSSEENIATIFPDYQLELFEADYPEVTSDTEFSMQWNLELISAVTAREKGIFGKAVKIAVIDSGLNTEHSDFKKDNILQGYNCIAGAGDVTDVSDKVGHGTSVSGVIAAQTDNQKDIAGIAPEVQIIPIKITDDEKISFSNIYTGIKKAIELDCDIINMSLGGTLPDEAAISEFKSWIDEANDAGIIVVAAVGNGGTSLNYPAAFENVIGVGSVDKSKNISVYSQQNESVFVTAPGDSVLTLSYLGDMALCTGTSLATPHVTAAVALMKELKPNIGLSEIKELLKTTALDLGTEGYDTCYGYGLIDIGKIIESLSGYIPSFVISQGKKGGAARIHIHNNSGGAVTADGYFVQHENGRLSDFNILQDIELNPGVTNHSFGNEYDCFMLWNNLLLPYAEKYTF